jgi:hypothetical protein
MEMESCLERYEGGSDAWIQEIVVRGWEAHWDPISYDVFIGPRSPFFIRFRHVSWLGPLRRAKTPTN